MQALTDILHTANIATRYAAARFAGLPACTCGRHQWDGQRWIMKLPVGPDFTDEYEGEPVTEAVCSGCWCYCGPQGEVRPDDAVAGGDVAPREFTGYGDEGEA